MNRTDLLYLVGDIADEGIVCVDRDGAVTLFNRKAKEITGILLNTSLSHPAGCIEPGDIVLLCDNMLGEDDGELAGDILTCLGIHDPELRHGDALLAIGVYQNQEIEPLYRHMKPNAPGRELRLTGHYLGLDLAISIDRQERELSIAVNGAEYRMIYLQSIGNMVIVDGATGAVKFFQDKGYTMRRETIGEILHGRPFQEKGVGAAEFGVLGVSIFDIVRPCEMTRRLHQVLDGSSLGVLGEAFEINKRLMLVTLSPVSIDGHLEGAILKLMDLSDMGALLRERNALIARAEETDRKGDMRFPAEAFVSFAGASAVTQQVKYLAYRAAKARCNVIITGESGTGKSQLANEIHHISRPNGPFVEVNCSSIPPGLIESELFGYVGGAFTGALAGGKAGYFAQADRGTLFLDELGELPPDIQVKLLYVIQNKRFYPVGGTKSIDVDVRILCATNRDLRLMVREGRFREDLYYRVNVFPIEIPPLRARISDIYVLSKSITERTCHEYGVPVKQLSAWALDKMLQYDWPGNIRELGNVIERAVAICDGSIIYPEYISLDGRDEQADHPADMEWSMEGRSMQEVLEYTEARTLRAAMARFSGDKKAAMEMLKMKKSVFYQKLKEYHTNP